MSPLRPILVLILVCSYAYANDMTPCEDWEPGWKEAKDDSGNTVCVQCSPGEYGMLCNSKCSCGGSPCDPITGQCRCDPGTTGVSCGVTCSAGSYGRDCALKCPDKCRDKLGDTVSSQICQPDTGQCSCLPGLLGAECEQVCDETIPDQCEQSCPCENGGRCRENLECVCAPGFQGGLCENKCPMGTFGQNCQGQCPFCGTDTQGWCDRVSGTCVCEPGWTGPSCTGACPHMTFGYMCSHTCECPLSVGCDPLDGTCNCGENGDCEAILANDCPGGWFGKYCQVRCDDCPDTCDRNTGTCLSCDASGKCSPLTGEEVSSSGFSSGVLVAILLSAVVVGVVAGVVGLLTCRHMRTKAQRRRGEQSREVAHNLMIPLTDREPSYHSATVDPRWNHSAYAQYNSNPRQYATERVPGKDKLTVDLPYGARGYPWESCPEGSGASATGGVVPNEYVYSSEFAQPEGSGGRLVNNPECEYIAPALDDDEPEYQAVENVYADVIYEDTDAVGNTYGQNPQYSNADNPNTYGANPSSQFTL